MNKQHALFLFQSEKRKNKYKNIFYIEISLLLLANNPKQDFKLLKKRKLVKS